MKNINNKNLITIILALLLVLFFVILIRDLVSNKAGNNNISNGEWQTYTNTKYGFSVKYPSGWSYREFPDDPSGAGFSPDIPTSTPAAEVITIMMAGRATEDCSIPFDSYVKVAGKHNIENFGDISSIDQVEIASGNKAYKTTWGYTDRLSGEQKISLPITYVEHGKYICSQGYEHIEVSLRDAKYADQYNSMVESLAVIDSNIISSEIPQGWSKSPEFGILYPNNIGGSVNEYYRKNGEMVYMYESGAIPDFRFIFGPSQDAVITWGGDYSNGDSTCKAGDFGEYIPSSSVIYCLNGRISQVAHFSARNSVTAKEHALFTEFIKMNEVN